MAKHLDITARSRGVSTAQVLLAWTAAQAPSIVPVFGAGRPATARDSAAAATLHLGDDELAHLEATS